MVHDIIWCKFNHYTSRVCSKRPQHGRRFGSQYNKAPLTSTDLLTGCAATKPKGKKKKTLAQPTDKHLKAPQNNMPRITAVLQQRRARGHCSTTAAVRIQAVSCTAYDTMDNHARQPQPAPVCCPVGGKKNVPSKKQASMRHVKARP